jgi:uncharacterized DUF497 family protein
VAITFNPVKRIATLKNRALDFADAGKVLESANRATWLDDRFDYGETRQITARWLDGRMVVIVWTQRGVDQHVISMRYCHDKETRKISHRFAL